MLSFLVFDEYICAGFMKQGIDWRGA